MRTAADMTHGTAAGCNAFTPFDPPHIHCRGDWQDARRQFDRTQCVFQYVGRMMSLYIIDDMVLIILNLLRLICMLNQWEK